MLSTIVFTFIYWSYSALEPVWAGTRVQSGDRYGSGTLHPGQVVRGGLPLSSPAFRRSKFCRQYLHDHNDARDPSSERLNYGRECCPAILPKWRLSRHVGIFYMPQIYYMGQMALLPLPKEGILRISLTLKNPTASVGFEPGTCVLKASTLPLDHWSRLVFIYLK
jgi:hypothetical protein